MGFKVGDIIDVDMNDDGSHIDTMKVIASLPNGDFVFALPKTYSLKVNVFSEESFNFEPSKNIDIEFHEDIEQCFSVGDELYRICDRSDDCCYIEKAIVIASYDRQTLADFGGGDLCYIYGSDGSEDGDGAFLHKTDELELMYLICETSHMSQREKLDNARSIAKRLLKQ